MTELELLEYAVRANLPPREITAFAMRYPDGSCTVYSLAPETADELVEIWEHEIKGHCPVGAFHD